MAAQIPSPIFYHGASNVFSHFYLCTLSLMGRTYTSVEQGYQHVKATCILDGAAAEQIMATSDARQIKQLSKRIHVPKHQWDAVKTHIMWRLDYAKYTSSPKLMEQLKATGNRPLVEDVNDPFWGVGNGNNGQNRAGQVLMGLRHHFLNGRYPFPEAFIIGDSLSRGISTPGTLTITIPGAQAAFVRTAAFAISGPQTKFLFLICGTNDIVDKDETVHPAGPVAHRTIQDAMTFATYNPECIIVLFSIFPRRGEYQAQRQVRKHFEKLVHYKQLLNAPKTIVVVESTKILSESELGGDRLHLSIQGQTYLSQIITEIQNAIQNKIQLPYLIQ